VTSFQTTLLVLMLGYLQELSDAQKSLISGGIAGSTGKTMTAPLSRLTVLLQVGAVQQCQHRGAMQSLVHTANNILKREGFRSFWKGNFTSVIHRFPYSAINFTLYEKVRDELCKGLFDRTLPSYLCNYYYLMMCTIYVFCDCLVMIYVMSHYTI